MSQLSFAQIHESGGDVGIGVEIPAAKLHIKGGTGSFPQLRIHEQGGTKTMQLGHDGTNSIINTSEGSLLFQGGNVGIGISNVSSNAKLEIGFDSFRQISMQRLGADGQWVQGISSMGNWSLTEYSSSWNSIGSHLVIEKGGNVGIGTSSPDQLLTISDDDNPVLRLERSGTNRHDWEMYSQSGGSLSFRGGGNAVGSSLNDRLTIKSDGNVGIGTIDPQNKLSVEGTIWAQEVKVSMTDAADWVFEDDYELRSLEEVETFVKSNKHLPDVPSADEFRKNDMNLGEMNNLLLQKMEEMTLYMIEMNKEVQQLKAENIELKSKINN